MAEPTESAAASQSDAASVANPSPPIKDRRDPKLIEREELLARMDEKIAARHVEDDQKFWASADVDPRAAAMAAEMAREARGLPTGREVTPATEVDPSDDPTPVEAMDEKAAPRADAAERQAREAVRISTKGEDPLGQYVVRDKSGKPMFKTLVNGEERLIPLDAARTQLQKHLAADIRMQQNAERQKQLEAREAALRQNEETFKRRQHPSAPVAPAFDDRKLANELVRSLVSEPEDKAAERMAETFRQIRQASAPQIDTNALVRQAADVAVKTIADRDNEKALKTGFDQFSQDYPDIVGDSDLFNLADKKTEVIAVEHPDWTQHQIMDEAGKQTRAWLKSIGAPVKETAKAPSSNQQRKQNLVPMPQARTARPATAAPEREQTPAEIVAEIRKQRQGY